MAEFYREAGQDGLWVHSERGLLSLLFFKTMQGNPAWLLEAATNGEGKTLGSVLGPVQRTRLLTEFELGKKHGFGCPDGGAFFEAATKSFVFFEAKRRPFADEYRKPLTQVEFAELTATKGIEAARRRTDGYNSSINGQLELRWRFVNALMGNADASRVTEADAPPSLELRVNDKFYLGRQPNVRWRTVGMGGELGCLYRELRQVEKFHLLAITADDKYPTGLGQVRLFDKSGYSLPEKQQQEAIFWLPFEKLMAGLERWTPVDKWTTIQVPK